MASNPNVPVTLSSFRGGMNDEDPPHLLQDDEVVLAENVEFFFSTLGERRRGMEAVDLTSSGLTARDAVVHATTHIPLGSDVSGTELWGVAATANTGVSFARRVAGTWSTVSPTDAPLNTAPDIHNFDSKSTHGKLFFGYKSAQARLHVWDGTTLRRTGLDAPAAAPTAADTGGAGTITGARTYRVRFSQMSGSTILRLSEPSAAYIFQPSGTNDGIIVTRPTALSEGETHWILEASNGSNFYQLATTVLATTTFTDTTVLVADYANYNLSPSVGDYTNLPSARFIKADQDRVIFFGDHSDEDGKSRFGWTPPQNDPGFGNDERMPTRYDSFLDLGNKDGGDATGLSDPILGAIYAFKWTHIYKILRTQQATEAYEALLLTDQHGAIEGSVVSAVDQFGRPAIYFLDPATGPARLSSSGLQHLSGLNTTWRSVNTSASQVIAHGVYYPDKQQIKWWVATENSNVPNLVLVLQTNEVREGEHGALRGWSIATGTLATALCSTVLPEVHADDDTGATSLSYRMYLGFAAPFYLQRADTGIDDDGDVFEAVIRSKPYIPAGLLGEFGATAAALLALPNSNEGVQLDVSFIRDFGLETNTRTTDFVAEANEELVVKILDDLKMSRMIALQVELSDHENTVGGRWELYRLDLLHTRQGGLSGA